MARKPKSLTVLDQEVASRVAKLRKSQGRTLIDLASAIGISYQQLQKYETAVNRISSARLDEIAKVLDVNVSYFLEDEFTFRKYEDIFSPELKNMIKDHQVREILSLYSCLPTDMQRSVLELVKSVARIQSITSTQSV